MGRVIRVEFRFGGAEWGRIRANLSERSIRHLLHEGGLDHLSIAILTAAIDATRLEAIAKRLAKKKPRKGRRTV